MYCFAVWNSSPKLLQTFHLVLSFIQLTALPPTRMLTLTLLGREVFLLELGCPSFDVVPTTLPFFPSSSFTKLFFSLSSLST
jgi:hypothetical protein